MLSNLGALYEETQRFADGEAAYREAIGILRALAAQNPTAYRPALAQTLPRRPLRRDAPLRRGRGRTLKEAADIRRALAAQNPAAYRPDLAWTLNNLASLYRDMHRDSDAKAIAAEAQAAGK
jgi:tetratricopeptide (TPR) repeat protein